jgi:hypothetical protein
MLFKFKGKGQKAKVKSYGLRVRSDALRVGRGKWG